MGVRAEYHGNKKRFLGVLRRKEEKMEKEKEKKTKIPPPRNQTQSKQTGLKIELIGLDSPEDWNYSLFPVELTS